MRGSEFTLNKLGRAKSELANNKNLSALEIK